MTALRWSGRATVGGETGLGHWIWVIPILLFVTLMSARQLDLIVPEVDEFYSMNNVGMVTAGPYSPIETLESLARNSPNHTPLYFILLNIWGHLVGQEIAMLRVLTVFSGLLSLALVYRLARDYVAPLAGLLALFVLASNAFFNFYYANARMYPLLMLTGALTLWLYLRLCQRDRAAKTSDYLALTAACYAFANTHVFSALLFIALGVYHLLHVRKDGRWLRVSAAVLAGLLLFSPWLIVLLTGGIERTYGSWQAESHDLGQTLAALHAVGFNGSMVVLLVAVAGLLLGWRQRAISLGGPLLISLYFLAAFAIVALLSEAFGISKARLSLGGWAPFLLLIAGGLYSLVRWRKWLIVTALLFPLAGLEYQGAADWGALFRGRELPFQQPAWHIVSRLARESQPSAPIFSYLVDLTSLHWPSHINYPQSQYYFADRGLRLVTPASAYDFRAELGPYLIVEPVVRVFYQASMLDNQELDELDTIMREANYEQCDQRLFGVDTVYVTYGWLHLKCRDAAVIARGASELIHYEFFGLERQPAGDKALLVDRWTAAGDFPAERYNLSHQLLSADWANVAQLDVPLVHEGRLRQFSLDLSDVPAGSYRLVAILYDSKTGERVDWIDNPDEPPYFLTLGAVDVPD